jgi:hypothetical protein
MSGLLQNNIALDGIILTNCCHEQEQLVDFLNAANTTRIIKLNIPRTRSSTSAQFLSDQLEALTQQFIGNSSEHFDLKEESLIPVLKPQNGSEKKFLPVIVFGIAIPPWFNGLLKENGLISIKQNCCGYVESEEGKSATPRIDTISGYAEKILYSSFCLRTTSDGFSHLDTEYGTQQPSAVLFVAMEYCTTAIYGFVKIKDFFVSKNIPVFKITITDWNKLTDKVITQIESLSHICKENKN